MNQDLNDTLSLLKDLTKHFKINDNTDFIQSVETVKELRKIESAYVTLLRLSRAKMSFEEQIELQLIMQDEREKKDKRYNNNIQADHRIR